VKLTSFGCHQRRPDPSQEDWPAQKHVEIQNASFMSRKSDPLPTCPQIYCHSHVLGVVSLFFPLLRLG
jgi:hypothetical protein